MDSLSKNLSIWKTQVVPFSEDICCGCLQRTKGSGLTHLYDKYRIGFDECETTQFTLRDAIAATYGCDVLEMLSTNVFCTKCSRTILKLYRLLKQTTNNYMRDRAFDTDYNVSCENKTNMTTENSCNEVDSEICTDKTDNIISSMNFEPLDKPLPCHTHCDSSGCNNFLNICLSKLHLKYCTLCKMKYENNQDPIGSSLDSYARKLYHYFICSSKNNDSENFEAIVCSMCETEFTSELDFANHIAGTTVYGYICEKCCRVFSSNIAYNIHVCPYRCTRCLVVPCIHEKYLNYYSKQQIVSASISQLYTVFQCSRDCEFQYTTRKQLISHVNVVHATSLDNCTNDTDVIYCRQCHKKLLDRKEFKDHVTEHMLTRSDCSVCLKKFCSLIALDFHLKFVHKASLDSNNFVLYHCSMCPLGFYKKNSYLRHLASHPKTDKHVCRMCHERFCSKSNYDEHILKHQADTKRVENINIVKGNSSEDLQNDESNLDKDDESVSEVTQMPSDEILDGDLINNKEVIYMDDDYECVIEVTNTPINQETEKNVLETGNEIDYDDPNIETETCVKDEIIVTEESCDTVHQLLPPESITIEEYLNKLCGQETIPKYAIINNSDNITENNNYQDNVVIIINEDVDKIHNQETDENRMHLEESEHTLVVYKPTNNKVGDAVLTEAENSLNTEQSLNTNEDEDGDNSDVSYEENSMDATEDETGIEECPYCEMRVHKSSYKKHLTGHLECFKVGKIPEVCKNSNIKRCPFCSYSIVGKDFFEGHINRQHLNVTPYPCDKCGKKFAAEYLLQIHKKKHANMKYICSYCGKTLISKSGVKIHLRSHFGVHPYKCDFCAMTFVSHHGKSCHMKRLHMDPNFVCNFCGFKSIYKQSLDRHIADVHGVGEKTKRKKRIIPNERNFACDLCGRKFFYKKDCKRHLGDVHGVGEKRKRTGKKEKALPSMPRETTARTRPKRERPTSNIFNAVSVQRIEDQYT